MGGRAKLSKIVKWFIVGLLVIGARETDPLAFVMELMFPARESLGVSQIAFTGLADSCLSESQGSLLLIAYSGDEKERLALVNRSSTTQVQPLIVGVAPDVYMLLTERASKVQKPLRKASLALEVQPETMIGIGLSHEASLARESLYLWTQSGAKEFHDTDLSCSTPNERSSQWMLVAAALLIVGVVSNTWTRDNLLWPSKNCEGTGAEGQSSTCGEESDG